MFYFQFQSFSNVVRSNNELDWGRASETIGKDQPALQDRGQKDQSIKTKTKYCDGEFECLRKPAFQKVGAS